MKTINLEIWRTPGIDHFAFIRWPDDSQVALTPVDWTSHHTFRGRKAIVRVFSTEDIKRAVALRVAIKIVQGNFKTFNLNEPEKGWQ